MAKEKPYYKLSAWLTSHERDVLIDLSQNVNTWEQGRQGTGYEKYNLEHETAARWVVHRALDELDTPMEFDAWLLRYPIGSEIPEHTDTAKEGMYHVRLNALIVAGTGGMLSLDGEELPLNEKDAYVFRPDIINHKVSVISDCARLVLSVGANVELEQAQALGLV